jgi:hypothetical protein
MSNRMLSRATSFIHRRPSMSFSQDDYNFPEENYSELRKCSAPEAIVIPYKPIEEPAWCKHNQPLAPKPKRFSKLNNWETKRTNFQQVVKWAVLAAGTASVAAPALMHIPH